MNSQVKKLDEQVFGRLTVLRSAPRVATTKQARWICRCECGKTIIILGYCLRSGQSKSCGCLKRETCRDAHRTHGMTATRTYRIWAGMKNRCLNPNVKAYQDYGGRGITICPRWMAFSNFLADMGERPAGMEVDRFPNNDGNYEPGNVRWTTRIFQARNTRANHRLTHRGKTMTIAEWSEVTGLRPNVITKRLLKRWPVKRTLETPLRVWA